jgi:chemotaxis protein methyltransferase CheR
MGQTAGFSEAQPSSELCIMSENTFRRFQSFIETKLGIKMPARKKTMLQARLLKRLNCLGLGGYDAYCDYVFDCNHGPAELQNLIDVVTTNKTDFFREPHHFTYLTEKALPELQLLPGVGSHGTLRFWSAGCSSGAEPYTLAMVLSEFRKNHPHLKYSILASDISSRVLQTASRAIYPETEVKPVPQALRNRYLLRGKDRSKGLVRIAPEIRTHVRFRQINLMDPQTQIENPVQVVFCRNVLIYFDRPTQAAVSNMLCRNLSRGGYVFFGHSETLNGLHVPLVQVASSVYRKVA